MEEVVLQCLQCNDTEKFSRDAEKFLIIHKIGNKHNQKLCLDGDERKNSKISNQITVYGVIQNRELD